MIYRFDSAAGVLTIRPHTTTSGWWRLWIDDIPIAPYITPDKAADDVAAHATGYPAFDSLRGEHTPADLSDWIRIR